METGRRAAYGAGADAEAEAPTGPGLGLPQDEVCRRLLRYALRRCVSATPLALRSVVSIRW